MSLHSWLLFVHVLGAIVWLGGGAMLVLLALQIRSGADPRAMAVFARTIPYVGTRVLGPAWIVVLLTGVGMVLTSAAWRFTQAWVLIALGLFAVAFLVGAVFMSRAGVALERASRTEGAVVSELQPLLGRWLTGYSAILAVLLVAVWDMVFKPGL